MIRLKQGLSIVEAEDGKVLLDTLRGVYWHLNLSALTMLEEFEKGRSFDEHVQQVATTAGVDEQRVRADYLALVGELQKARLVDGKLS